MKGKKWAAMVLAMLLVLQLSAHPTQAAGHVYFIGAQENILPVSDDTMPFWYENYLYVSSTIFSGAVRDSLNVARSQGSDGDWVALYRGGRALLFKRDVDYAEDQNGRRYYPGGVERGGVLFVPAGVVTDFFGLKYSMRTVSNGTLAWMRTKDFILTEERFVDAASNVMAQRYQEYLEGQRVPEAESPPAVEPPAVEPPEEETPVIGQPLYLCVRGSENTPALLDVLERYDSYLTFFCTPEFMAEHHDLLRRLDATGQGVGILVQAGEEQPPVAEQLEAANRALEQATLTRTRLVRAEGATPEQLAELLAMGYCPTASALAVSGNTLATANQANNLFRAMTTGRRTAVVWVDGAASSAGLNAFLSRSRQADDPCMPLRETTEIH